MDLESIYNDNVDKIYKYFYFNCIDKKTAEDLTSTTFMKMAEKIKDGLDIQNPQKYLYGIMRRVWSDHLRDKYKARIVSIEDIEDFEAHTTKYLADNESTTLVDRARQLLEKLPEKQQLVLSMRLIGGMTVAEVAKELGKNRNYVKTTQRRGVKRLNQIIGEGILL